MNTALLSRLTAASPIGVIGGGYATHDDQVCPGGAESPPAPAAASGTRMMIVNKFGSFYRLNDSSPWAQINDPNGVGSNPQIAVSGTRMVIVNAFGSFYRLDDSSPWIQINDLSGLGPTPRLAASA